MTALPEPAMRGPIDLHQLAIGLSRHRRIKPRKSLLPTIRKVWIRRADGARLVHDWPRVPARVLDENGVAALAPHESGDIGMAEWAFEDEEISLPMVKPRSISNEARPLGYPVSGGKGAVAWHLIGFFLTLCGAAAAFVPSAIQGLPDRTLLA